MNINYCIVFEEKEQLPKLYEQYYYLMHENQKESIDFHASNNNIVHII